MSYASVTAKGLRPTSAQPHPDMTLLNTQQGETQLPSVEAKITVAPSDFKEHPRSADTEARDELEAAKELAEEGSNRHTGEPEVQKSCRDHVKDKLQKAGRNGLELWEKTQGCLLRPGVAGGLLGVVNVGLLGSIGYSLYTIPVHRSSPRFLSTAAFTTLAIFGGEAVLADAYSKTEAGQREEARAREEGAALYRHAKTVILRPGILGGAVGALNLGILGGLGYWSYVNWDNLWKWDRRQVSAVSIGLLALFAGEGYLGQQYEKKKFPKHK